MISKIEVTIDVIVHATEDISKIFQSFEDVLEIKEEDFTIEGSKWTLRKSNYHVKCKSSKKTGSKFYEEITRIAT